MLYKQQKGASTFSITTLGINSKKRDTKHNDTEYNDTQQNCRVAMLSVTYAEWHIYSFMPSVVRLNVVRLSVMAPAKW